MQTMVNRQVDASGEIEQARIAVEAAQANYSKTGDLDGLHRAQRREADAWARAREITGARQRDDR
jgi:hypothetical protein